MDWKLVRYQDEERPLRERAYRLSSAIRALDAMVEEYVYQDIKAPDMQLAIATLEAELEKVDGRLREISEYLD